MILFSLIDIYGDNLEKYAKIMEISRCFLFKSLSRFLRAFENWLKRDSTIERIDLLD